MVPEVRRGRRPIAEEDRIKSYGVNLRPTTIETLRRMAVVERCSQGDIVERALFTAQEKQFETIGAGREAFEMALKGWSGYAGVAGAPEANLPGWWIFSADNEAQRFAYISDAALFRIGRHGDRGLEYLAAFPEIPMRMRVDSVIYIDVGAEPHVVLVDSPFEPNPEPVEEAGNVTPHAPSLRSVVFEVARNMRVFADNYKPDPDDMVLTAFWKKFPFQSYAKLKDRMRVSLGTFSVRAPSEILPASIDAIRALADDLESDAVKLPADVLA